MYFTRQCAQLRELELNQFIRRVVYTLDSLGHDVALEKCFVLTFSVRADQQVRLTIQSITISNCNEHRFLGIIFDKRLAIAAQVEAVTAGSSSSSSARQGGFVLPDQSERGFCIPFPISDLPNYRPLGTQFRCSLPSCFSQSPSIPLLGFWDTALRRVAL